MKRQDRQYRQQLDLPLADKNRDAPRSLDRAICKEVAKLLGLLLSDCACGARPRAKGAHNEQNQR